MRILPRLAPWLLGLLLVPRAGAELSLRAEPDRVELSNASQRIRFQRDAAGRFQLATFVRSAAGFTPLFDGGAPLLQGPLFDLYPTAYRVMERTGDRLVVELSGRQEQQGYDWKAHVTMTSGSELVQFRITCVLPRPLILVGLEPQAALWMKRPATVTLNQGPGNVYTGSAEKEWGNSFPAAYLWVDGLEAAVFFDASVMTWMSHRSLFRFRDCRTQAFAQGEGTGLGLRVVKRNFHELPAGELVFQYYLHAAARPAPPSKLEALQKMMETFGPLHPASAPLPINRGAPGRTDWGWFARGVIGDLMRKDLVWEDVPLPADAPWHDAPMFPERTVSSLRVSPDYAVNSSCDPALNRTRVSAGWDFSTCHNYLAAWIACERLEPDPAQHRFLEAKTAGLPLFYDPQTQLIRHGTRYPLHVGDREMSWQNFTFVAQMLRCDELARPADFNPAIAGRALMGLQGLIELAHHTDYLFPQWFDAARKTPVPQGDLPELGDIREPWQIGAYAWLMCQAHELTGERRYLDEATRSLDRLFGGLTYETRNARYVTNYADPTDFPITEIFGNSWGVAAAERVHRWTGLPKYLAYSDHFLASLLRLTYWYESDLRNDPIDLAVHNLGLFRNHSGAYTGSPWENSAAYLPLTLRLKHDRVPSLLLLKLCNVYRVNSLYYFPAVFPDEAIPCARLQESPASFLPIEDTYTHEHGGRNGGMGRSVYMSEIALWNHLLFDALAETEAREVMILNLSVAEGFDAAADSIDRSFIAFNPTTETRAVRVRMKMLAAGNYVVAQETARGQGGERRLSAAELAAGLPLTLPPLGFVRLHLTRDDAGTARRGLEERTDARHALAHAYQRLQETATVRGLIPELRALKQQFEGARRDWDQGRYSAAGRGAKKVVEQLRN